MAPADPRLEPRWVIYGANGYTGSLIAEEAARRGLRPVLAGRNRDAIEALAARLQLPAAPCDLEDRGSVRAAISGCRLVLHCAGPFAQTSRPMLDACLAERAHYLDITGEIDVFSDCFDRSPEALERGVSVIPGVGFDVVPTDSAAALLKEADPNASSLVLAFEAGGGPSQGTARTSLAGLTNGGRVRRGGKVTPVPLAYKTRTFLRNGTPRPAMTIPWGDVFTAGVTTGIPNVEVYMLASPATIANARRLNWVRPLLRFAPLFRMLERRMLASVRPPSVERRAKTNSYIWGEVSAVDRVTARVEIETPNGYDLTVTASLGIVEHILREGPAPLRAGYLTPSQLMGPRFVLGLPGVVLRVAV